MTIITQKTAFYVGHIEQLPRHFCLESQNCFLFGNDEQHYANKGAEQKAEHRLGASNYMILEHVTTYAFLQIRSAKYQGSV